MFLYAFFLNFVLYHMLLLFININKCNLTIITITTTYFCIIIIIIIVNDDDLTSDYMLLT
jgi:hypothetical protein